MEINHFSHDHPLVLSDEEQVYGLWCRACNEPKFGLCYCCVACRFVLHKWCAELPRELSSSDGMLHRADHSLVLSPQTPESYDSSPSCKICKYKILGFSYVCASGCSLKFHPQCASFPDPLGVELPYRDSKSYLITCDSDKLCDLCRKFGDNYILESKDPDPRHRHIQCAMLPPKVKISNHMHDLVLRPPLQENEWYTEFFCDACEKERRPGDPVYYCEPCEFVAHVGCGVIGLDKVKRNLLSSLPREEEDKVAEEEEGEEQEGDDDQKQEVTHHIHEHPLKLVNSMNCRRLKHTSCYGCGGFMSGMIYACYVCDNFFLHKWCGQLPKEIRSSVHPDLGPLRLLPETSDGLIRRSNSSGFCEICGFNIYEFYYKSENFGFLAHARCALLPNNLKHPSHEHALTAVMNPRSEFLSLSKLPYRSAERPLCQACGYPCISVSLECTSCNFHLHPHCFLLPATGKHKSHRHDLILKYSYQEDPNALEYICEDCNKPRTPKLWVYTCPDPECDIVTHIDCAVPNFFTTFELKDD